jgi:Secretion system C-terminal sorting domain
MKKQWILAAFILAAFSFVASNPNCPTGYTMAPTSTGTSRNCTTCHGDYSLNTAGGGITLTGLPSTFTAGVAYPFSIKIAHSAADRQVWGYAIKAVDTTTNTVVGTWTSTNANSSIKGAAGSTNYELSHANAAASAVANTYTYAGLTWTAPSVAPSKVKFYVSAVAGNNNGNEAMDYVYTTTFTSAKITAPTPCTFTYGQWTACSNGTQTRTYTTSPAGCTGTPPADSITRTCTVPVTTLPTAVTITAAVVPGVCDTIRTFTVPNQTGVTYAWAITGTGNSIISGQGTNSIRAVTKVAGSALVSLSNQAGSIPAVSSAFTRALPPSPSAINGSLAPCPGSSFAYSLTVPTPTTAQVAVARFRWTLPLGARITTSNADSSQVNITFGNTFVGGTLAAKGESACNIVSAAKSITLSSPAKVVDMVTSTGFLNFCIGSSANFIAIAPAVGTTAPVALFRWTTPAFTTITSANADSSVITLSFNTGYKGGAITVKSAGSCGALSAAVSKTLTHLNCAIGQRGSAIEILTVDQVGISPNPNNGKFVLNIQTGDIETKRILIRVFNVFGKEVAHYSTVIVNGLFNKTITLPDSPNGVYIVNYIIEDRSKSMKMILQK